MSDRYAPTAPSPPGNPDATGRGVPAPAAPSDQAELRDEVEAWINEGGAGDEPGP